MSLTIHDLRVSLRQKTRECDELTGKLNELRTEFNNASALLKESNEIIRKKDEIISIKESIIKEKDNQILKMETEKKGSKEASGSINNKGFLFNGSLKTNGIKHLSIINPLKSKRVAVSGVPTQNLYQTKDSRVQLVEYPKNNRYVCLVKFSNVAIVIKSCIHYLKHKGVH